MYGREYRGQEKRAAFGDAEYSQMVWEVHALKDVNLTVNCGEVVAIIATTGPENPR
jgi:ABC-type lipoprotein export system ATPase subunit